jgi:broad specificity phosphatase PhoE
MGTRTLYLIRHAQYERGTPSSNEALTALGRRQAARLARRLSSIEFAGLIHSDLPRAVETADILAHHLPALPRRSTRLLREGIPTIPPTLPRALRPHRAAVARARDRMERAFERFVCSSRAGRNELVVAHGNLIRYLIRRALGDSARDWWRLEIQQCSLSILRITSERCALLGFNDVGHLPGSMQTYL